MLSSTTLIRNNVTCPAMDYLFPHDIVRNEQSKLMKDIETALLEKKNLIAHAPTGLGKTASALSVALPFALEKGFTVFFLTNRHTQHLIAVETLREIKKKFKTNFVAADIIGKKPMCLQDVKNMSNSEFMEFCKISKEQEMCEFYLELYNRFNVLSTKAAKLQDGFVHGEIAHVGQIKEKCDEHSICPYYFTAELAKGAQVIIADYFNLFSPVARKSFLARIGKELEKSIVIVDEAHNLADRIRDMMSSRLSAQMVRNAMQEAQKFSYVNLSDGLRSLLRFLEDMGNVAEEKIVGRNDFLSGLNEFFDYDMFTGELEVAAQEVREAQHRSSMGGVAEFLRSWKGSEEGFVRYIEKNGTFGGAPRISLYCSRLDTAELGSFVFDTAYASILMSGTLTPTAMFRDVLGVSRCIEKEYASPFPPENRKVLVVPETTTQYKLRSETMFGRIAAICKEIIHTVPGNSAFFFPSYEVLGRVQRLLITEKTVLIENAVMTPPEKQALLETFKSHAGKGAALLAVSAGNFSEGIDLPGDYLKTVCIVGLPLAKPDIRTRALIQYYDSRFRKGWEYGYVAPAMMKCLQAAGRCIRTPTDRGVIIFIDQRFIWPQYFGCIPHDWEPDATRKYVECIELFFRA